MNSSHTQNKVLFLWLCTMYVISQPLIKFPDWIEWCTKTSEGTNNLHILLGLHKNSFDGWPLYPHFCAIRQNQQHGSTVNNCQTFNPFNCRWDEQSLLMHRLILLVAEIYDYFWSRKTLMFFLHEWKSLFFLHYYVRICNWGNTEAKRATLSTGISLHCKTSLVGERQHPRLQTGFLVV